MSWSLSVSGHVNTGGLDGDQAAERALLDEVRRFLAGLDPSMGVTYASWIGQHTGNTKLVVMADRPPASHEEAAMVDEFRRVAGEPIERAID